MRENGAGQGLLELGGEGAQGGVLEQQRRDVAPSGPRLSLQGLTRGNVAPEVGGRAGSFGWGCSPRSRARDAAGAQADAGLAAGRANGEAGGRPVLMACF